MKETLLILCAGALIWVSAQAEVIDSSDGIFFTGGAWTAGSEESINGWTILANGEVSVRGSANTAAFASDANTTWQFGSYAAPNTRIGRDFLRNACSSLDTNGPDLGASYSWYQKGDILDFSGAGSRKVDFTSGMIAGSNWLFVNFDAAPVNYTGYTVERGGVSQIAVQVIWDDVDGSGTRTEGDTYDFGAIRYATGGDVFNGWDASGVPTVTQ
jgi:hypothetical protein